MGLTRRQLLTAGGAACLTGCRSSEPTPALDVRFVGQTPARGHVLRSARRRAKPVTDRIRCDVLIVGGGATGAAAAWRLQRAGVDDVRILELENEPGGTARAGSTPRSRYPMGAHYLPSPAHDFRALQTLLEDLGIVTGRDANGRAVYDTASICAAPMERLFSGGTWTEGLYPADGETPQEAEQWRAWRAHLRELDRRRGADGRRLFALPVHTSSTDLRHLDALSMAAYLDRLGLTSQRLRWSVEYACRDDYGCTLAQTSAFAALHHYLARGLEEDRDGYILAWPEGNARLVDDMLGHADLGPRIHRGHAALSVTPAGAVVAHDFSTGHNRGFDATVVLWAAPRFLLPFVLPPGTDPLPRGALTYAPWLVANVEVARAPGGIGAPLSWDNVALDAEHLGYVLATHAEDRTVRDPSAVLTFYQPFPRDDLTAARTRLLEGSLDHWVTQVTTALEGMHPGITPTLRRMDIARWGHAMIRPVPGLLFGDRLVAARAAIGAVIPCGTDVTGLPLFEQAFAAGVGAAEEACRRLGRAVVSLI